MPGDANAILQAQVTKTAAFNSTGLQVVATPINKPLWAKVIYKDANTSSGAGSAVFRITESDDDSTYSGISQPPEATLTLGTTAIKGELSIPIVTKKKYIRLELATLSGTGATITYQARIEPAKP